MRRAGVGSTGEPDRSEGGLGERGVPRQLLDACATVLEVTHQRCNSQESEDHDGGVGHVVSSGTSCAGSGSDFPVPRTSRFGDERYGGPERIVARGAGRQRAEGGLSELEEIVEGVDLAALAGVRAIALGAPDDVSAVHVDPQRVVQHRAGTAGVCVDGVRLGGAGGDPLVRELDAGQSERVELPVVPDGLAGTVVGQVVDIDVVRNPAGASLIGPVELDDPAVPGDCRVALGVADGEVEAQDLLAADLRLTGGAQVAEPQRDGVRHVLDAAVGLLDRELAQVAAAAVVVDAVHELGGAGVGVRVAVVAVVRVGVLHAGADVRGRRRQGRALVDVELLVRDAVAVAIEVQVEPVATDDVRVVFVDEPVAVVVPAVADLLLAGVHGRLAIVAVHRGGVPVTVAVEGQAGVVHDEREQPRVVGREVGVERQDELDQGQGEPRGLGLM